MAKHRWSEADDIAALYVYRFGIERLGMTIVDLARSRDIKPGSFRMRMKNFQALDGKRGLENWADQSEQVFRRYATMEPESLRQLIIGTDRPTRS
jgi:hypothetical protein